jgi:NAD(P)H-hydrate epimerase
MNVISVKQSNQIDTLTVQNEAVSLRELIYKAAGAVYEVLRGEYMPLYTKKICIVCGKGHNGSDGLALALILKKSNISATVLIVSKQEELCSESIYYYDMLRHLKADVVFVGNSNIDAVSQYMMQSDVLVDALLGTGLNKEVTGIYAAIIKMMNMLKKHIISIDIPSGINGNTGLKMKEAVQADIVVIMQYLKYGNVLNDADDYAKKKIIKYIGLMDVAQCKVSTLEHEDVQKIIKQLPTNIHKYHRGNLLIVGGSHGMEGSIVLSAKAAYRNGTGLVSVAAMKDAYGRASVLAPCEVMVYELLSKSQMPSLLYKKTAIAAGMGMPNDSSGRECLHSLLQSELPLVLDAGALSILAEDKNIIKNKKTKTILTPHTGELAKLLGYSPIEIAAAPIDMAKKAAVEFDSIIVLKMNKTVIADQNENVKISIQANAGMATAGSGDVLTGVIASNINDTDNLYDAACAGVCLHALAGKYAMQSCGERYMNSSDIISNLAYAHNEIFNSEA